MDKNTPDRELVEACSRGDEEAVEIFYNRYKKLIYWTIYKWMSRHLSKNDRSHDADDIFQEIFLELIEEKFTQLKKARNPDKVGGLIYYIAYYKTMKYFIKKDKDDRKKAELPEDLEVNYDFLYSINKEERELILDEFIATLNTTERKILKLQWSGKKLTYQEIAEIMGLSASHIGVLLNRISEKLKTFLQEKGYTGDDFL